MVIAHRLATVLEADRIIVLDEGRILDIGPHQDLVERNAAYAQMVKLQFSQPASSRHFHRAAEA